MKPKIHFTSSNGWINDPHGITFMDGKYHSFFQHVPGSIAWAPSCHWGHAVGPSLFEMVETDVALSPGEGDDGIWTGTLVGQGMEARIFYTSIRTPNFGIGKVKTAHPQDKDWRCWNKGQVLVEAPLDLDLIAFRDPFIRRDEFGWRMFLGGADRAGNAMALSYFSEDLDHWSYEGIVLSRSNLEREDLWTGSLWECPQFVTVGNIDLMISSIWDNHKLFYAAYAQGEYNAGKFRVSKWGQLTYGDCYYAPSFFEDSAGEPCLQFWMREISDEAAGWAGAHSIPYRLMEIGGKLHLEPHPEIKALRQESRDFQTESLEAEVAWDVSNSQIKIFSGQTRVLSAMRDEMGNVSLVLDAQEHNFWSGETIRIVLDGPILEICTGTSLFGARIEPTGQDFQVECTDPSQIRVYSLKLPSP